MEDVDKAINGLEFLRRLDGLQILGVTFVLLIAFGAALFFILIKKGKILKTENQVSPKPSDEFQPRTSDPNINFFESRVWMKDRVLDRHIGWIRDAFCNLNPTESDIANIDIVLDYAKIKSSGMTNYIVKKNQFGTMPILEWKAYQQEIPLDIIKHVSRNISTLYAKMEFSISREEMLKVTELLIPKCIDDLAEMFQSFRDMEKNVENDRANIGVKHD